MKYIPRVHGNGFIQLDLTHTRRLHIWGHEGIPRQKTPTPVHDHAFGFTSRILLGCLQNRVYEQLEDPDGAYMIHTVNVRDREDTTLHPTGEYCALQTKSFLCYRPGETYKMEPGQIHQSIATELTVSIIDKTGPTLSQGGPSPRVFVERGLKADNTFHRYDVDEQTLWAIIADTLIRARV